jgi:hypothetical protein
MTNIALAIAELGNELVACSDRCPGIACLPDEGRPPRCLYLETDQRDTSPGTIVIGLNPGRARADEISYFAANGVSYRTVSTFFFRERACKKGYYTEIRRFVDSIEKRGPILWTELVKCENEVGHSGTPPLQTLRHCTSRFLTRELEAVPPDWLVLGIGREAYTAAAYLLPRRAVVGVPHPNSRGQWSALFRQRTLLKPVLELVKATERDQAASWVGFPDAT